MAPLSKMNRKARHKKIAATYFCATGQDTTPGGGDEGGGGDTPVWLPEGAVAFADFVNGHYYAGGSVVTLTDMFTESTVWGSPFDPDLPINSDNPARLAEAYMAPFVNGATIGAAWATPGLYANLDMFDDAMASYQSVSSGVGSRAALTVTTTKAVRAVDGGAAENVSDFETGAPFTQMLFSGAADYTSIAIYPPKPDADLPALSALS